mgnify:CR=1 FL=1
MFSFDPSEGKVYLSLKGNVLAFGKFEDAFNFVDQINTDFNKLRLLVEDRFSEALEKSYKGEIDDGPPRESDDATTCGSYS